MKNRSKEDAALNLATDAMGGIVEERRPKMNCDDEFIKADDMACDAAIKKALLDFDKHVQASVAARRAAGIPDPVIDTSPERQAEVLAGIQKEMDRLRPLKNRLLYGK